MKFNQGCGSTFIFCGSVSSSFFECGSCSGYLKNADPDLAHTGTGTNLKKKPYEEFSLEKTYRTRLLKSQKKWSLKWHKLAVFTIFLVFFLLLLEKFAPPVSGSLRIRIHSPEFNSGPDSTISMYK